MKITDVPTAKLLDLIEATERSSDPDQDALRALRAELSRRLDSVLGEGKHKLYNVWFQIRWRSDMDKLALRLREAAKLLSVSPRTLWAWAKAGLVPCRRIGQGKKQVLLFSRTELERWLAEANSTGNASHGQG